MPTSYFSMGPSVIYGAGGIPTSFETQTFELIGVTGVVPELQYTYTSADPTDTTADVDSPLLIEGLLDGNSLNDDYEFRVEEIVTPSGASQIMIIENLITARETIIFLGGAILAPPTTLAEFNAIAGSIISSGRITSGPFAPGVPFAITSLPGLVTGPAGGTFNGTSGDDLLTGAATHDLLQGFSGNDTLNGGAGSDEILPGTNTRSDIVHTGPGSDRVDYSTATYGFQILTYEGDADPVDVYINGTDNEGSADQAGTFDELVDVANALTYSASNPLAGMMVIGTDGADSFNINVDTNQWMALLGGDGVDSYNFWGPGAVRLDFRGGTNGVVARLWANTINNDGFGNSETFGGSLWELRGTDHADDIQGTGNGESFILRGGNDTLDGGQGFDRLRYDRDGATDVTVNLQTGTATGTWDGVGFTHAISNIEHVRGSSGDDVLIANSFTGRLRGGDGADRFVLAPSSFLLIDDFTVGTDTLDVSALGMSEADMTAALFAAADVVGGTTAFFNGANVTFSGLTAAQLGSIDYTGTSTTGGDDDTHVFLDGVLTHVNGSIGNDTYNFTGLLSEFASFNYWALDAAVTVNIDGSANTGTVDKGANGSDTLVDVTVPLDLGDSGGGLFVGGTIYNDTFNLNTAPDQWMAAMGGVGNDTFNISGDGVVRLDYRDAGALSGIVANLVTGVIQDGMGGTDNVIGNPWEIRGTHLVDQITGSDRDESFILLTGSDTLDGGAGWDRLRYDRSGVDSVNVDLSIGTATGIWNGLAFNHTISGIEYVRGSNDGADTMTGDANQNRLQGRGGNDTILGMGGDDTIEGGDGNDSLVGGVGQDSVYGGDGNDTLDSSDGDLTTEGYGDYVRPGLGTNLIIGNATTWAGDVGIALSYSDLDSIGGMTVTVDENGAGTATSGTPGSVNDAFTFVYYVQGSWDADTLIGTNTTGQRGWAPLAGDDTITGGAGQDALDYWWENTYGAVDGVNVVFTGDGTGTATDGFGDTDTFTGIEQVWGTPFDDTLTGHDGDERFEGNEGNDLITGGLGDDTLLGGDGNDTFLGTQGFDSIDGGNDIDLLFVDVTGTAADAYTLQVDMAAGTHFAIEFPTGANDTITGIENYTLVGDISSRIIGDGLANHLITDNGRDTLNGGLGNDTLEGGDNTDTLIGGDGNDSILGGDSAADLRDIVYAGAGHDYVDGGYGNDELRGDAGNDTILGSYGADTVIGGDGDDQLTAQAFGDEIFGGAGADFINGGFGHDRVNGGTDADRFFHIGVFDHGSDWIQDYSAADGDVLQFGQAGNVSQFQVNFTETASAGTAGVEEAFVIYRPTGQILWALVDGQAQSSINLLMGGVTYDLLA